MTDNIINYKAAFKCMPGNSILVQPDPPLYTILAVTDGMINRSGLSAEQLVNKPFFEPFPSNPARPDDPNDTGQNTMLASFKHVINHKEFHHLPVLRYDLANEDGTFSELYWHVYNKPILDDDGKVLYILHTSEDITEKVKAQKREEEIKDIQQSHNLFMQAPVAIHIFKGPGLVIELANELTQKLWDRDADIIGKTFLEVLPELEGQGYEVLMHEVIRTGQAKSFYETPLALNRAGKKETGYYNFVFHPYYEEDKTNAAGVLIFANEVTEQVLARKKVLESEQSLKESEKFSNLLEALPQMTWTNLPNGDVNFYNQKWYNYTGLDFEQTKGWGWKGVVHPDDLPGTLKDFMQALQTGNSFVTENRYKNSDGRYRWHLNRALPIKNEKDKIILWVGTATDIHDLKQVEKALQESENRYKTFIDETPVANALFMGRDMQIEFANNTMIRYWGKDSSVIGKTLKEALPELEGQPFLDLLHVVYDTGKDYVAKEAKADFIVDGKLQSFYFNFTYKALSNSEGEVYGIHEIAIDVTEQVMARNKVEESAQRLASFVGKCSLSYWSLYR